MNDILAAMSLKNVVHEQQPPTIDSFISRLANHDMMTIHAVHQQATLQWWSESTVVYHVVRNSIDLSGIYEEMDLTMIRNLFYKGDYQNGVTPLHPESYFLKYGSASGVIVNFFGNFPGIYCKYWTGSK